MIDTRALRAEILRFDRADGGLDLYDPLLERHTALSADEAQRLPGWLAGRDDEPLGSRLSAAMVVEGDAAQRLRQQVWNARRGGLAEAPLPDRAAVDARLAPELPDLVAAAWREPEAWRRLAEDRAGGRERLTLRGFVSAGDAATIAAEVRAQAATRFETDRVRAWRGTGAGGPALAAWRALLEAAAFRALVGGVFGVPLGPAIVVNTWRMAPGDGMRAHPDGRRYAATWALGLNAAWTAADAGAIAFGEPGADGFAVRERWLPFAGDVLLFVPHATSWHVVEPPRRERLTLSGWWTR